MLSLKLLLQTIGEDMFATDAGPTWRAAARSGSDLLGMEDNWKSTPGKIGSNMTGFEIRMAEFEAFLQEAGNSAGFTDQNSGPYS